ncbi:MAG: SLC13/DASS family transporter [Bacteroidales bacterium]|nr:SLC13/DASS family transporter [Bacteroidales bacterium]MCR5276639.1 SLC13 family permease [Bacteroidales bacterium]
MEKGKLSVKYCVLLPIVLIVTVFLWVAPSGFFGIDGLTATQQRTIAIFAFAALMWIFEIVPNWVTSLIVIVGSLLTISNRSFAFCMNTGDDSIFVPFKTLMSAFADPTVMLFMGGFVLAIVASKYGMDVTMARILLKPFGTNPKFVLLGVLLVIAIFSMFMSNTATAAMFLAFLAPVFASLPAEDNKGKVGIALAIPVAANVGGIGTPIGTPPNATAKGILENNDLTVTFGDWALRMIPFVIIMLLLAWVLLMVLYPFKSKEIKLEIKPSEQKTTWRTWVAWITFGVTILLWMTEQLTHLNANIVALIPLAVYTATGVFTKEDIKEINWSVLWLVAGGFALGYALDGTGLAKALVTSINFSAMSIIVVFVVAGLICYFLSNFISNSATAALLIPIMVAMGNGLLNSDNAGAFTAMGGQHALAIFVAVCASLAMLLPISTPPNAIAASTGMVETKDMTKVGLIVGVVGLILGFVWVTKLFPFAQI